MVLISDWMRKWREIVKPITKRGNTKASVEYLQRSIEKRSNQGLDFPVCVL